LATHLAKSEVQRKTSQGAGLVAAVKLEGEHLNIGFPVEVSYGGEIYNA
jgi:hypothetical protein